MTTMRAYFALFSLIFLNALSIPNGPARAVAQCGIASWYGYGDKTASGEEYDIGAMTAAHKSLPFGTIVRVENMRNGRTVTVRINDRGPFIEGRVIDLSLAAALVIDPPEHGRKQMQPE
jgi:rare lipoprotein A